MDKKKAKEVDKKTKQTKKEKIKYEYLHYHFKNKKYCRDGIIGLENRKNKHQGPTVTKPRQKPLRKIVEDLAKEMRDGFKKVNERLDNLENCFDVVIRLNNLKTS